MIENFLAGILLLIFGVISLCGLSKETDSFRPTGCVGPTGFTGETGPNYKDLEKESKDEIS